MTCCPAMASNDDICQGKCKKAPDSELPPTDQLTETASSFAPSWTASIPSESSSSPAVCVPDRPQPVTSGTTGEVLVDPLVPM